MPTQFPFLKACVLVLLFAFFVSFCANAQAPETITIDANAAESTPFPHFWEQAFGSGRMALALRARYQSDLHEVKRATDVKCVRGHAIFHDELGVYSEDKSGNGSK